MDWYRGLPNGSITTWAQLVEPFILEFNELGDPFSLLTQFTSIKRYEQENILDFNIRFQKAWMRVPMPVRPQQFQALMYYLRAFPSDLSLQIQNFEVNTFLKVYRQAVYAEACVISVRKLPSCMPMPYFLVTAQNQILRPQAVSMAPPLASILALVQQWPLTLPVPRAPLALPAPPQPNMNQGVASSIEIQELQNLCRNMANHITILSRQSNVRRYPYPAIEKA